MARVTHSEPAFVLTEERISSCTSDDDLFSLLSAELQRRLPEEEGNDLDAFLTRLRGIPVGLRAMAAMYQIDVSMALDDIGWHFLNWPHKGYARETIWALRELGATRESELFEMAFAFAEKHWTAIEDTVRRGNCSEWYHGSELEWLLEPLNREMYKLCQGPDGKWCGMLKYWPRYARQNPHKVVQMAS